MQNPTTIYPNCLFVHEIYNKFNFKLNRQLSPNDVRAYRTFFPWRSLYIDGIYNFIRTQNLVLCVCVYLLKIQARDTSAPPNLDYLKGSLSSSIGPKSWNPPMLSVYHMKIITIMSVVLYSKGAIHAERK